jgi:hypothetical protein
MSAGSEAGGSRFGSRRVRELVVAGLIDSFGLSLGWTVFNLLAVMTGGLTAAAMYNAAMLVGVVLSAPATAWLAHRLSGRSLLSGATGVEMVLRVGTLAALLAGWPTVVVAGGVTVMFLAAWIGYAAMRAEVAVADGTPAGMTRYSLGVAAVEAAGAGLAALLPIGAGSTLTTWPLAGLTVIYGACLVPTLAVARRARVRSAHSAKAEPPANTRGAGSASSAGGGRLPFGLLAVGALIMLFASGPTLLSVALATQLHGPGSVAGSAAAFSAGCLLSSRAVDWINRRQLPISLAWPLWGIGMLAGWAFVPYHVVGLFVAQFLAGLSMTSFEGAMDARIARHAPAGRITTVLAWSGATRAVGSAAAVRLLPMVVAAPAVGLASTIALTMLALGGLAVWALVPRIGRSRAVRSISPVA